MNTATQTSELTKHWNRLDNSEKLQLIEEIIEDKNSNDGFLMLQYVRNQNCIYGNITNRLQNHLCVEAVSATTLIELFGEDHDFQIEDAEVILNWIKNQN